MNEKEVNIRTTQINTIIYEVDEYINILQGLKKNLPVSINELSDESIKSIQEVRRKLQNIISEMIISSEKWSQLLNYSVLSGEYYFVKKNKLEYLLYKLSIKLDILGFLFIQIKHVDKFEKSFQQLSNFEKSFKNVTLYVNTLKEMITKYLSLIEYTQIRNNQKIVKSEIEINQLLNNNIPDENSNNLKKFLLAMYPNILLAEIDHDFHAGSDMENKLNLIIKIFDKEIFNTDIGKKFILYKILYDKANFLLYKVILRKYKNSDTDGNVWERTNLKKRLTKIKKNITYFSEFIDEINKAYLNGVI